ncbi:UDP-2,3-diacylglucosamine diphosphatase [Methylogaea oryzae]|uniref:UDP-2,3-diacylglucosamine diphosphatase n=1 Tax=Methylogaea oryzae TaxID=1295382 RepID=UPI0006D19134|nr:UDP-2,3-diacylglucosamine diphosphatase [Methylogaea oryzae]
MPKRKESLFISDLHLSAGRRATVRRFLQFLRHRAPQAERLYILGDLFDAWVGDDDNTPPNRAVKRALRALSDSGTEIYYQHGNRDFLIGERFLRETGCRPLPDHAVIDLYGTPTLLMHGDLLCSDDLPYLAFRALSRTAEWRDNILGKPLLLRLLGARWYRLRSYWHKSKKSGEIMDVNQDTVRETMQRHGATRLIHGHTHRPAVHDFQLDGAPVQRFVLAEWDDQGSVSCWTPEAIA